VKIKIVKCSVKGLWYMYRVGEVFDVIESSIDKDFWVVKNIRLMPCLRHSVRKTECRPITLRSFGMVTSTCYANVRGDRIQFLIRQGERGYRAFAKVLTAIDKGGFTSWYGDVCDKDGNEQCGLIVTTRPQEIKVAEQPSTNNDYAAALRVIKGYRVSGDVPITIAGCEAWCEQRLHSAKEPNDA
jgi:hypothetical protein